jgi:uncharacterized protein
VKIRLDEILDAPCEWEEVLSVTAEGLGRPEVLALGEIDWRGRIEAVSEGFLMQARLSYQQTLACTRCLTPVVEEVAEPVEMMILKSPQATLSQEVELTESDFGLHYVEGEVLDTEPIVLEQMTLNIPMKALCREDCRGICPSCGARRGEEACSCEDQEVDPRWAGLQRWRQSRGE